MRRQFSREQLAAVDISRHGTDACVVAGPGSGKTTVLVERFHQLVTSGIHPRNLLAITFTEKAANNMKSRLALGTAAETAYVSTVHGFCLRLLRENAIRAGVDPQVAILPEAQSALLQQKSLTRALDELLAEQPEAMTRLMRSLSAPEIDLIGVYDALRSSGISVEELRDYPARPCEASVDQIHAFVASVRNAVGNTALRRSTINELLDWGAGLQDCRGAGEFLAHYSGFKISLSGATPEVKNAVRGIREQIEILRPEIITAEHRQQRSTLIDILVRFESLYAEQKRGRGMLDFADLESYAVRLLEDHADVRAQVQGQFQQVLMDEFQDTNLQQSKLLAQLRAPGRFYAVGDVNQSIFGFRHSSPEVFTKYSDGILELGGHHAQLVENWRSRPEILQATTLLLRDAEGVLPRPLVAARTFPAKKEPSVEVIAVTAPEGADGLEWEARWVAHRVSELRGNLRIGDPPRAADLRDMVILVRNSAVYETFSRVFADAGIPLEQSRRKGFFESREALDLTHLLRTIANPQEEISTAAVLRSPFAALSDEALLRMKSGGGNLGESFERPAPAGMDAVDLGKFDHFRANLRRWRDARQNLALDRLLLRAIDESGYPYDPLTTQGENIERFLKLARASRSTLIEFIDELKLLREADQAEPDAAIESQSNAVRMMTAHSAKGLEFPVAFLAALHKGVDSGRAQFSFTPEYGLGAQWISSPESKAEADSIHRANAGLTKAKEKQEANRLFYVALTRAEEHLVLSYSKAEHWGVMVRNLFQMDGVAADGKPRELAVEGLRARVLRAVMPPPREQMTLAFEAKPEALVLARPLVSGQQDSAVTVTELARFAKDPQRTFSEPDAGQGWARRRLAGVEDEWDETRLDASELGSQVHALLAGTPVERPEPRAHRLATNFRTHELGRRAQLANRIEREHGFLIAIEDVVVRGQIDLWFEENGRVVLIDYKTDDVAREEAQVRAEDYAMQIHLYALVLERMTGRLPDEAYIHFLRGNVAIGIKPDPELARETVRRMAEAQNRYRL